MRILETRKKTVDKKERGKRDRGDRISKRKYVALGTDRNTIRTMSKNIKICNDTIS